MIFVKNSRGGRELKMINTVSKINLSKIGWQGDCLVGYTSIVKRPYSSMSLTLEEDS